MNNYDVWVNRINNEKFQRDTKEIKAMSPLQEYVLKCLKLEWAYQNNPVVRNMVNAGHSVEDIVDALARHCNNLEKEIEKLRAIEQPRYVIPVAAF